MVPVQKRPEDRARVEGGEGQESKCWVTQGLQATQRTLTVEWEDEWEIWVEEAHGSEVFINYVSCRIDSRGARVKTSGSFLMFLQ